MSWQDVWARKLKCSPLVMAYSALFNNVFDALNLLLIILYTYVAEIQLPGNGIRLLAKVLPWLDIGDFNHIMSSTNAF